MAEAKEIRSLADLRPDPRNANRGTERGGAMLDHSLRRYGAGRSILADKHGTIIAGSKTLEQAAAIGLDVLPVHTSGDRLVVVVRDDLDLATDPAAAELGIADNRVGQIGLDWSPDVLAGLAEELDLSALFRDDELDAAIGRLADFDPATEWGGMPAFEQDDLMPAKSVQVNFGSEAAVEAFARLVGQNVTMATKSVWYPAQPRMNPGNAVYAEADHDAA